MSDPSESWLSVRHNSKHFTGNKLLIKRLPFYRCGNRSIKKHNNLLKATWAGSGRAKTWTQGAWVQRSCSHTTPVDSKEGGHHLFGLLSCLRASKRRLSRTLEPAQPPEKARTTQISLAPADQNRHTGLIRPTELNQTSFRAIKLPNLPRRKQK